MKVVAAGVCVCLCLPVAAVAAPSAAEGRELVEANKCEACHQGRIAGPVGTIYLRKDRKVKSWANLKSQVGMCSAQLNLKLFPEDEESIAAFLNETYYKLPVK